MLKQNTNLGKHQTGHTHHQQLFMQVQHTTKNLMFYNNLNMTHFVCVIPLCFSTDNYIIKVRQNTTSFSLFNKTKIELHALIWIGSTSGFSKVIKYVEEEPYKLLKEN